MTIRKIKSSMCIEKPERTFSENKKKTREKSEKKMRH